MKQKMLFTCELCNTDYSDEQKALECEQNHKIPSEVIKCRYSSKNTNPKGYPLYVTVKFTDGSERIYKE